MINNIARRLVEWFFDRFVYKIGRPSIVFFAYMYKTYYVQFIIYIYILYGNEIMCERPTTTRGKTKLENNDKRGGGGGGYVTLHEVSDDDGGKYTI